MFYSKVEATGGNQVLVSENCEPHAHLKKVYGDETIDINDVCRWVVHAKKTVSRKLRISSNFQSGCPKSATTHEKIKKIDKSNTMTSLVCSTYLKNV